MTTRRPLGIATVGLGWMGQAHSRSFRRIPALFADRTYEPALRVCADPVDKRRQWATSGFGFETATDDPWLNGVLVEADSDGRATSIRQLLVPADG